MDQPKDMQGISDIIAAFDASTAKLKSTHDILRSRVAELSGELSEKNRELESTLGEVSALKNYLANILESITDGVLAIDLDQRVVALNEAAAEAIPHLVGEREGRQVSEVLPAECRELGDILVRSLESETRLTNLEVTFHDDSGVRRSLSVSASPIRSENGDILGAVETFRDLTAIKHLEERANRQERLAALGEMAAGVAHEIRNPLGGIELYAGVIKRNLQTGKESELAEKIMAAAGSLNRIVTDMLTFTRGRAPVKKQVPVEHVINSALELAVGQVSGKNISVERAYDLSAERFPLDDELLSRAFLNVILNAVQVMDDGGVLRISARLDQGDDGRDLIIEFADSGPGVPPDAREKLFHPFFTLRKDGTGLGLAITHKIIQDHGGSVAVCDNSPKGAVFSFHLPVGDRQTV